ncbi:hypothetical protein EHW99_3089 [Erwinia amylovora]|uniref:Uncharacterized protein n=2 Tax=Erwinia amylovora TaxID=552 RepID=A0A830ZZM4_ERWAM|nr:hypothetical protein EaACW_0494 [Erwinia amylovora ACW56400]QJQ55788.1 hypothetical protein EHX00_3089 [Erwinia amylovora]CBA19439.1 hypothetical protein predicted by Glimmer/Critica [Erwinia amylovora CFBP1430]CCO77339.1 hypothetical protein BN432_0507 [Erwinia amylovora Ea356]CCO81123.1 hypothetical protein BN433_0517 [Erwinia amylovora Ea266]CCO84929.1 hypothetical protein BN434_0507 [Erwinia amylovora CFBP 2585]CCO88714.1 hypothetical protein BN435_0507 [Erwinia amylovora 01SFR-BO]CCO
MVVLHDLSSALNYADKLVFLKQGRQAGIVSEAKNGRTK